MALADGFIRNHLGNITSPQQIIVCSSPYVFIPTAAHYLAKYFLSHLNRWLAARNLPTAQETRVHRTLTYQIDYSKLDTKDRLQLLKQDHLHINRNFLEDKMVLFIDDMRITGAHEKMLERMIEENNVTSQTYFIYFAGLTNSSISPCVENNLNFTAVQSIFDLEKIIKRAQFSINDRFVKYVLGYHHIDFHLFLQAQQPTFVTLLLDMALGNGYHHVDLYSRNLETIYRHLSNELSPLTPRMPEQITDGQRECRHTIRLPGVA
ncbi:hypothetical protein BP5796_01149 [Coleophoma crateriformis]|uniref:Uncharacterized protein n=1 Tax=Coleophoma crateriformis TaxID=565419 RepID=A0A3D8SZL4_9HELO|nr:hypothetical protein BP5796_01149 [Coleophoma crateriformis]